MVRPVFLYGVFFEQKCTYICIAMGLKTVIDTEFAELCEKRLKRGDVIRIGAMLQMTYATTIMHLKGVRKNPIVQSAIMDYFDQRDIATSRAEKYVRDRIRKQLKAKDISGYVTADQIEGKILRDD